MNEEFELPDVSNFVSDIQDYFEYILKKHKEKTDNTLIRIYINKIEYRITFSINTRYYLERLTPKSMKLFGSTKIKLTKNKAGGNLPHLKIDEVVLVHCNIFNNDYQQYSRVLHIFIPNKSFDLLLDTSPKSFIFLKACDSDLLYIEV